MTNVSVNACTQFNSLISQTNVSMHKLKRHMVTLGHFRTHLNSDIFKTPVLCCGGKYLSNMCESSKQGRGESLKQAQAAMRSHHRS